jgi:hypothetical protein
MLSFFGLSAQRPNEEKKFGDLKGDKNIPEQLEQLKGKVEKTMNKNKGELQKFRELSKFNENLSKSYVANLKVITDVSGLLNAYNEFFEMFKTKLAEIDQELGVPISTDDFEYMKKLTTEQLVMLDDLFKTETNNLKKLYSRYGKQKEYDEVETAEQLFEKTKASGETTYRLLKNKDLELPPSFGGAGAKKVSKAKKVDAKKKK